MLHTRLRKGLKKGRFTLQLYCSTILAFSNAESHNTGTRHCHPPKVLWTHPEKLCRTSVRAQEGHRRVLHGSYWDAVKGLLGAQGLPLLLKTTKCTEHTERRALERAGWCQRRPLEGAPFLWRHPGLGSHLRCPFTQRLASLSWAESKQSPWRTCPIKLSKYPSHTWVLKDDPTPGEHPGWLHSSQSCHPEHLAMNSPEPWEKGNHNLRPIN